MKTTAKIPTSKAKTAYGLLSEVAALVLAEPLRLQMGEWKATREGVQLGYDDAPPKGFPACGTVGCIGGWVETLKPRGDSATTILGLTFQQGDQLFFSHELCNEKQQQTPEHAKHAVEHIRRFQKKYRAQLLAKKV